MSSNRRALNLAAFAVAGALMASAGFAQDRDREDRQDRDRIGQQDRGGQMAQDRAGLPAGIEWSDEAADVSDVRSVIDDIAGAAVIENGFNDVVERFVDQDRNRFGEWMDEGENREFTEFNAAARRFQDAYEAKFNKEFDFDAEKALVGLSAIQGEVENPTLVASNWPVQPTMGAGGADEARVAGGVTNEQGNIEEGRQVAIATIPAPHKGQPMNQRAAGAAQEPAERQDAHRAGMAGGGLRVSLVNEFPGTWKVDVPNSRAPQQVYADLAQCVGKLADNAAQWGDETQVQHMVAHEVLCAIYGVKMSSSSERKPPGGRGLEMDSPPGE